MNTFQKDKNGQEILLSDQNEQVMMEWEKPYMEASMDMLKPTGHVLEIGFGCGYSATQIMTYKPKSYTVIECDSTVIKIAKEWAKNYPNIMINVVEGRWQEKLHKLGIFDEIYFDDFPLEITQQSSHMEKMVSLKRINIFLDLCIQNHTKMGSKISWYINGNPTKIECSSDTMPFIKVTSTPFYITIPDTCKYRNLKEQQCTIPLLIKVKEYNFKEAQRNALNQIQRFMLQ